MMKPRDDEVVVPLGDDCDDEVMESYAVYPTFFDQKTGYKVPEEFLNVTFRFLETYAYYIGIPVYHVLIILLITIACLIWWKLIRKNN